MSDTNPRSPYVLVVDDSPTMRRMVMTSLRPMSNVQLGEAGSGLEAIERLAVVHVDLMILDLNMPEMHGVEVLQFVRAHKRYRTLPVLVLTTRGDDLSRTEVMAAGATAYLTKPFRADQLLAQVRKAVKAE